MSSPPFNSVAIFGPGLLGGSLAQALRRHAPSVTIRLWARRPEALDAPRQDQAADLFTTDLPEACTGSDLAVLCTPVTCMPELAESLSPLLPDGALLTDVGSVKSWLQERIPHRLAPGRHWIGSHPMAGKESGGYEHASDSLFADAPVILTPADDADPDRVAALQAFWESVGGCVRFLTPQEHDRYIAAVSHVPHLVSAALMHCTPDAALSCAGPGFRDMTRIAASPADLWQTIFATNQDAVLDTLKSFSDHLAQAGDWLHTENMNHIHTFLESASRRRRELP